MTVNNSNYRWTDTKRVGKKCFLKKLWKPKTLPFKAIIILNLDKIQIPKDKLFYFKLF